MSEKDLIRLTKDLIKENIKNNNLITKSVEEVQRKVRAYEKYTEPFSERKTRLIFMIDGKRYYQKIYNLLEAKIVIDTITNILTFLKKSNLYVNQLSYADIEEYYEEDERNSEDGWETWYSEDGDDFNALDKEGYFDEVEQEIKFNNFIKVKNEKI